MNIDGLDIELSEDLEKKIISHRNNHLRLMIDRTFKALISTISYENFDTIQVDPHRLEHLLRCGKDVAIGKTNIGTITILGYSNHRNFQFDDFRPQNENKIIFTIPENLREKEYKRISLLDNCATGNYIVISNQEYYSISDIKIISHYARKLCEIEASRMSLIVQAKCLTYFKGDKNDETLNQVVQKFYNGSPFLKLAKNFDIDKNIGVLEHTAVIAELMTTLKQEYNTVLAEMCQILGINSFGIAKESGISSEEINANNELVLAMANIYIKSRQSSFDLLNKRYGYDIKVIYDNDKETQRNIFKKEVDIQ